MSVVRNDIVRVGADFSGFVKGTQQGEKAVASFNISSNKVFSRLKSFGKAAMAAVSVTAVIAAANKCKEAYESQAEANAKLEHVMSHSMGARAEEIASVKDLTDAQQSLGVISADIQAAGAQELATYVSMTGTLKKLIPVMNDMTAQQYGYNTTAENAVGIATMLGKVMNGQTGALSRYGYSFTEAQAKVLKYGNEEERVAVLADVVSASVGGMNEALAQTPTGRLQQVKNRLDDIQASFGAAVTNIEVLFLPALNTVNNVLAGMANLANMVAQSFVNVFGGAAAAAGNAVTYTGAATSGVDDLTESLNEAGSAAEKLGTAGFDTLQKLSGTSSGGGSGGSAGGGASITSIVPNLGTTQFETPEIEIPEGLKKLERILGKIKEIIDNLDFSNIEKAWGKLKTALEKIDPKIWDGIEWVIDNILAPLANWTINDLIPNTIELIATAIEHVNKAIENLPKTEDLPEWFKKLFKIEDEPNGGESPKIIITGRHRNVGETSENRTTNGNKLSDELGKVTPTLQAINDFFADTSNKNLAKVFGSMFEVKEGSPLAWVLSSIDDIDKWLDEPHTLPAIFTNQGKINNISGRWKEMWDSFAFQWDKGLANLDKDWNEGLEKLKTGWERSWISKLFKGETWAGMWTSVKKHFGDGWSAFRFQWNSGLEQFGADWEKSWMSKLFKIETWSALLKGMQTGLGNAASWLDNHVFNPIARGFEDTVNGIIGGINKLIEGVNNKLKITLPKWSVLGDLSGKSYGVNIPKLQPISITTHIGSGKFATGGAITRPTVGLIGEAGPERVIPLSQDAKWLDALASRIRGNSSDPQLIAMLRTILQYLRAPTPIVWNDRELGKMTRDINRREAAISGVG